MSIPKVTTGDPPLEKFSGHVLYSCKLYIRKLVLICDSEIRRVSLH